MYVWWLVMKLRFMKENSSMAFDANSTAYNPMRTFSDKIFYDQQFFWSNERKFSISCSSPCKHSIFSSRFTKCWWNLNVFHKFISLHTSMPCFIPKLINFHYNFWTDFSIFSLVSRQLLCSSRQLFLIEWWKIFLYAFQLNISHFYACCHAPFKVSKKLPSKFARW